jgi:hypothetical protein
MGIPLEVFNHYGPAIAAGNKLSNPAFTDGNHCKLCAGKKAVYQHQQDDYQQLNNYAMQSLPLQTKKLPLSAGQTRAARAGIARSANAIRL